MKTLFFLALFTLSLSSFALDMNCSYTNHDGAKGNVSLKVDEVKLDVSLEFSSATISANNCSVSVTPQEINIECDEEENTIGVILELINGQYEGILISEKASVFGEAKCK